MATHAAAEEQVTIRLHPFTSRAVYPAGGEAFRSHGILTKQHGGMLYSRPQLDISAEPIRSAMQSFRQLQFRRGKALQTKSSGASMISAARLDLATEYPIRIRGVGQYHRDQHHRADQKEQKRAAGCEPPRLCRRPFGLSYAANAGASSMA